MSTHHAPDHMTKIQRGENGGIIVLLLLLAIPLVAMVAYVVDLGISLNTRAQMKNVSDDAALGALSQYLSELPPNPTDEQIALAKNAAVIRAEQIATISRLMSQNLMQSPDELMDDLHGTNGSIDFGFWWFADDPDCNDVDRPCPGCDQFPCFESISEGHRPVNAVRLTLRTSEANPLKNTFARAIGAPTQALRVESIATEIPRIDFIMFDLSRSIYRDNYWRSDWATMCPNCSDDYYCTGCSDGFDPAIGCAGCPIPGDCASCLRGTGSEFAYELSNDCSALAMPPDCSGNSCDMVSTCNVGPESRACCDSCVWQNLEQTRPVVLPSTQPMAPFNPFEHRHYRDEVRCRTVTIDGQQRHFFIDHATNDQDLHTLAHPQPLIRALEAINHAMDRLSQRAVALDRFGFFGFDTLIAPERRLDNPLAATNHADPRFEEFYDATDIANFEPTTDFVSKALFPLNNAKTDLYWGLENALNAVITGGTSEFAEKYIVVITDGQTNCTGHLESNGPPYQCANFGSRIFSAINELRTPRAREPYTSLVQDFIRNKVSVSMVMIGPDAHTVLRKGSPGAGCLDEVGSGIAEQDWVDSDWSAFAELSPGEQDEAFYNSINGQGPPFYVPSALYEFVVKPTNGVWAPIRPCLRAAANGDCIAFDAQMTSACDSQVGSTGTPIADLTVSVTDDDNQSVTAQVTDSNGRLLFDPLGRSVEQQMFAAIDKITFSPYKLVDMRSEPE